MGFNNIDEYISLQPEQRQFILEKLRQIIKKAAPEAEEVISYQMPAFKFHGMLIWFAAFKNHYGLYPFANTLLVFKEKLKPFKQGKGSIQFPFDKPIPVKLITEIIQFRIKENLEKKTLQEIIKTKKIRK